MELAYYIFGGIGLVLMLYLFIALLIPEIFP